MVADPRLNTHTGRICNHMNVDHVHTVLAMARMEWPAAQRASLTEVTETGVAIVAARGGERRELAIAFKPPAKDMMEARSRLTALHHDDGLGDGRRVVIRGRRLAGLRRDKPLSLAQIKAISRVVFEAEERERKAAGATDEEATRAARRVSNKAVRSAKAPRPSDGADAALERAVAEAIGDEGAASLLLGAAGLQAILDELELPPSQRHKLIRSGGKPRGCTLGVTSKRDGTCVLANATDLLDSLLPQALNAYFRARAPREARDAFVSSIQVNRYDAWRDSATPHVDRNNLGPSWIIAFGEFEGGELWVEGEELDAADAFQSFDGRDYHATLPFSGGPRYSLVFYCVASHARLGKSDRDAAELLGFRLPPPGEAPPPRRGATRGMGLDAATRAFDAAARAHDDYPQERPAAAHPFG